VQILSGITVETLPQWGVVIGASLVAAIYDLRERRIPNALTVPLLVAGLVWAAWRGGLSGLANGAAACFLLALPFVLMFLFAAGGAGDAKLMAAIGAWLGLEQGIIVLGCVCVAGGVLAIATAIAKRRLKTVMTNIRLSVYSFIVAVLTGRRLRTAANEARPEQTEKLTIPYGVAIFVGVCAAGGIVLL
jgi:prepilin peptidase CpaA